MPNVSRDVFIDVVRLQMFKSGKASLSGIIYMAVKISLKIEIYDKVLTYLAYFDSKCF